MEFKQGLGLCLTHAARKGPGGVGWVLRLSTAAGGPRMPPASECRGSGLGPQQAHWGPNGQGKPKFPPILQSPRVPPGLPLFLLPLPPSHTPRTHVARGCLRGRRTSPRTPAGSLGSKWVRETLAAFSSTSLNPQGSLPVPVDLLVVSKPL